LTEIIIGIDIYKFKEFGMLTNVIIFIEMLIREKVVLLNIFNNAALFERITRILVKASEAIDLSVRYAAATLTID